jgi:acyl carrier protein
MRRKRGDLSVEQDKVITIIKKKIMESITQDIIIEEVLLTDYFNSLSMMKLIVDLESEFDITFDDDELLFDNFSTLSKFNNQILHHLKL